MRIGALMVVGLWLVVTVAGGQTTTTAPTRFASLADGEVRYTPPPEGEWGEVPIADSDGRMAAYRHEEGYAVMTIGTNEQRTPIPNNEDTRFQLGTQMIKAIRADIQKSGAEEVQAPRLQRGERTMITIRDRIRKDGVTTDRLHLYRAMGYQLVRLSVRVEDQGDDVVNRVFATGQEVLGGAMLGKRDRKAGPATRPARR